MSKSEFAPEIRFGYEIGVETKKLWKVQLDLLGKLDDLCSKYGLKYYAQGGTLLGAARHGGFIPWDDDVDVVMLWDDYKMLLQVADDFLEEPYFLQSYISEAEAEPTFSRLRRSDTTGCTRFELECITPEYNKGIFIDIFPLFNVPDDEEERIEQTSQIAFWWKLWKGYEVHRERELNGFSNLATDYDEFENLFLGLNPSMSFDELKTKYIEACSSASNGTKCVAPLSFRATNPKTVWPREWFDETVFLPFEDMLIPAPRDYIKMLEFQYGDWYTPRFDGAMHEMGIFDAEVPYSEKLAGVYVRDYYDSDYNELLALLHEVYDSDISKECLEAHYLGRDKHIFIAALKGRVVGCAFLSINRDYIRESLTSFVTYVAVDQKCRRMGIATKLFAEIERRSKSFGCTAIELTSADFRKGAHAFYHAREFTVKKTTVFIKEI